MTSVLASKVYLSNEAFVNNLNVTSVNLNNVEWTNNSMYGAFQGCNNITNITGINDNVQSMVIAFEFTNISSVPTLPKSATTLHSYCWMCNSLTSIPSEYPPNVNSMYAAYWRCNGLTDVSNVNFNKPNLLSALCFSQCSNIVSIPSDISVYNCWNMFNYCSKVNFSTLNVSAYDMGGMFWMCPSLKNITVNINTPQNITYGYATRMFDSCYGLSSANILFDKNCKLSSVDSMFNGCYNLSSVNIPTIPNNLQYISSMFNNCSNLTSLSGFNLYNSNIVSMAGTFNNCSNLAINSQTLTFPSNLIHMNYTFRNCSSLENIPTIPNSVTNMSYAFSGCSNLHSVGNIPESVTYIDGTFYECSNLTSIPNIETNNLIFMNNAFYNTGVNSLSSNQASTVLDFSNQYNLINVSGAFYNIGDKFNELRFGSEKIEGASNVIKTQSSSDVNVYIPYTYSEPGNHRVICYKYQNNSSELNGLLIYSTVDAPNVYGTTMTNFTYPKNMVYMLNNGVFEDVGKSARILRYRYSRNYFIQMQNSGIMPFVNTNSAYFYRDATNDILMPYNVGDYSTTYNSFIAAGYDENGTKDGVYLKDIDNL